MARQAAPFRSDAANVHRGRMDISVVIATYNRANVLDATLKSLAVACADRRGVEVVVADNNSRDDTASCLRENRHRLPLRVLHAPRQGKNAALNEVLAHGGLGDVVVFTDDDVIVDAQWLDEVRASVAQHGDVHVFGGVVEPCWRECEPPSWAASDLALGLVFGRHAHRHAGWYPDGEMPVGANFWVRRGVFGDGLRFDERVGPRPTNRIMGSESTFLGALHARGYGSWHVPSAVVWHRIDPQYLARRMALVRAWRLGRGLPYKKGLSRSQQLERSPVLWAVLQAAGVLKYAARFVVGCGAPLSPARRCELQMRALVGLASKVESLHLARQVRRDHCVPWQDD